jgi:hypothetical protein
LHALPVAEFLPAGLTVPLLQEGLGEVTTSHEDKPIYKEILPKKVLTKSRNLEKTTPKIIKISDRIRLFTTLSALNSDFSRSKPGV